MFTEPLYIWFMSTLTNSMFVSVNVHRRSSVDTMYTYVVTGCGILVQPMQAKRHFPLNVSYWLLYLLL